MALWQAPDSAHAQQTEPKVEVSNAPIEAGAEIEVAFTAPGTKNDWITIVRKGSGHYEAGRFDMLDGRKAGSIRFRGLPPGQYEVRLLGGEAHVLLTSVPLTIEGVWREPEQPPSVRTERPFYRIKEPIAAYYEGAWIKEEADHLVIAEVTLHDSSWTRWFAPLHAPDGWVSFAGLLAGSYELRLYRGRSKTVVARHRFDVGEPLADKFAELAGGALAEAAGWDASCAVLVNWISAGRRDYPTPDRKPLRQTEEYLQWQSKPYLDPVFIPVFGSPIEQIQPATRKYIYLEVLSQCRQIDTQFNASVDDEIYSVFGGGLQSDPAALTFERAVSAAERHRVSAPRLLEAETALDALGMGETTFDRIPAVEATYASDIGWVTAQEAARYHGKLAAVRTEAANVALKSRTDRLIASAAGLAGARALAGFEVEQAVLFASADSAVMAAVRAAIVEAIAAQLRPLVDGFASRLAAVGTGSAGVAALAALYRNIQRDLGDLLAHAPADQLMQFYIAREREIVPDAVPEMVADIAALPTLEATNQFRETGLGRPEAWDLVRETAVPIALRDRQIELWVQLESGNEQFWPLPEMGPREERLMAELAAGSAPEIPPPMGHEIMLATIREIEAANGERVGPNTVIYRLLPFDVAMSSIAVLPPSIAFNLPNVEIPVEAEISLDRVLNVRCSSAAGQGVAARYDCAYRASAGVQGLYGAQGLFANAMQDTFEFTGSGWRSSSLARRLEESSVIAWGALAEGLVGGMEAGGCVAGAFGGIIDPECY